MPLLILAFTAVAAAAARRARNPAGGRGARRHPEDLRVRVPAFIKLVPELALPGAWMDMKGLQLNPGTALPGKMKELMGLGGCRRRSRASTASTPTPSSPS